MIGSFAGLVAVITGAGSGIGRASALSMARKGADIAVSDINPARAEAVAAEVRALGRRAIAVPCDVSRSEDIARLRQQTLDGLGKINILMNNAGVVFSGDFLELDIATWRKSYDINLFAVIEATQLMLPDILEQGTGHVVNVASVTALYPFNVDRMSYNSARAAVVNFSESLALALWPKGIGVTCLAPGPTRTNMIENVHFVGEPKLTTPDLPLMEPEELGEMLVEAMERGVLFLPAHQEAREKVAQRGADPDAFLAETAGRFWNQHA